MLGWLFGKTTRIEDLFFGSLLFIKAARGHLSYWEGARAFDSVGQFEVSIDTSSEAEGPTSTQRDFFRRIERDYKTICAAVEARCRTEAFASRLMPGRFEEAFVGSGLSIPLCDETNEEWSIYFDAAADGKFNLEAMMRGHEVLSVVVCD